MNISNKKLLGVAKKHGTPVYVYDLSSIQKSYKKLESAFRGYNKVKIFYAIKANPNKAVVRELLKLGAGLECVSVEEVKFGLSLGFKPKSIFFTCVSLKEKDLRYLISKKVTINIDSISQLERYGKINPGGKVSVRLNGDIGAGHHEHVVTGGANSKFGIHYGQLSRVLSAAKKFDLKIIGLHQHIGSNIFEEDVFLKGVEFLMTEALKFGGLEFLDFGGGFGIPYEEKQKPVNINGLAEKMVRLFSLFCKKYGRNLEMIIEPGRYLVGNAGVLLVGITDTKANPYKKFVMVDSGFNHLLRPAMYGAYHKIENISRESGKKEIVTVAGNVCESGDVFANNREIVAPRPGDILAIYDAGAYGFSMSSNYHLRKKPNEVII